MKSSGSGCGKVAGPCEYINEPRSAIKSGKILEKLADCYNLQKTLPHNITDILVIVKRYTPILLSSRIFI
jgi:hypothetical protein